MCSGLMEPCKVPMTQRFTSEKTRCTPGSASCAGRPEALTEVAFRLEGVEPTGGLWVGRPTVTDDATAGLDVGEQELLQTLGAGVLDDAQSSAPKTLGAVEFYGCGEQHLAQRTAPRYAWFRAAQEGLIDLHIAGEPVPSW